MVENPRDTSGVSATFVLGLAATKS